MSNLPLNMTSICRFSRSIKKNCSVFFVNSVFFLLTFCNSVSPMHALFLSHYIFYCCNQMNCILENIRQEILRKKLELGLLCTDSSEYQFCSLSQLTTCQQLCQLCVCFDFKKSAVKSSSQT